MDFDFLAKFILLDKFPFFFLENVFRLKPRLFKEIVFFLVWHTNIAATRLNRPWGQISENFWLSGKSFNVHCEEGEVGKYCNVAMHYLDTDGASVKQGFEELNLLYQFKCLNYWT